nr:sensory neuron membrane protein 1a [Pachyrhinus yasumatsui]
MKVSKKKIFTEILFVIFPSLRATEFAAASTKRVHCFLKKGKEFKTKMRFPVKLAIGSLCAFFIIILVGFIMFPKMIKGKIKGMVNLGPTNDIRGMFVNVPFGLDFNIYIFSTLNPEEVQNGGIAKVKEFGPFCYQEWKTKINVEDNEADDTMSYNPVDTFYKTTGPGCVSPDTEVTIPHPMILGMVNTIVRQKPGALTLANKAIKSIWSNPTSLFVTVKARELLFDGVVIHCGVQDFAGKAICTQLKAEPSLVHLNENDLAFSLLGSKNGTPGKTFVAYRGTKDYRDVGRIVTFDGQPKMNVWNSTKCDAIMGTDGTIFPPMLKLEEGLASFAPDLCRSLVARFEKKEKYDGILVSAYNATLGDQSKNPDEKCFCTTPDTCLKKGLMDLYKCAKVPIYVSQAHFYDSHESYLKGVKGLKPNKTKHGIKILFEATTGSPVWAKKRLQFNMPLEPNPKVDIFHNFTPTVFPLFWVEEGVALNDTFTKPLKDFFKIKKIVGVTKYVILVGSIAGFVAAAYLYFKEDDSLKTSNVQKVEPADKDGTVFNVDEFGGKVNEAYDNKF